jgi:hypothetical protein
LELTGLHRTSSHAERPQPSHDPLVGSQERYAPRVADRDRSAREIVWFFAIGRGDGARCGCRTRRRSRGRTARPGRGLEASVVPNLVFHGCANLTLDLVGVPAQAQGELAAAYALVGLGTWLLLGRAQSVPEASTSPPAHAEEREPEWRFKLGVLLTRSPPTNMAEQA